MDQSPTFEMLTATAERALIADAQSHGPKAQQAKEQLVRAYNPFIENTISRYSGFSPYPDSEFRQDLRQAAVLGLLQAVQRFDLNATSRLYAYAKHYVNKELLSVVRQSSDRPEVLHSFATEAAPVVQTDPLSELLRYEVVTSVGAFLNRLTRRQRLLLKRMFWREQSLAAAAQEMGISKSTTADSWRSIRDRSQRILADAA